MSVLNQSGEEQVECPLCMEPLEVDDLHFYPCTCGYQICRFCWNRIREGENGLCPACRKAYPENPADFTPLSQEQVAAIKTEKKAREQKRRNKTLESRRALANVRVVQNNLVFVVGLPVRLADPEILKRQEYFGKYGKIHKVVINQSTAYAGSQGPSASAYVTYVSPADALRAIQGVNNVSLDGRVLKGSLGTTKYCANFMKNQPCPKPDCMYLHELGDPKASFTKEEMHAGLHQVYERKLHNQLLQMQRDKPNEKHNNTSGNSSTNAEKGSSKEGNQSNFIPTTVVTSSHINVVNSTKSNKKDSTNSNSNGNGNGSGSGSAATSDASSSASSSNGKEAWPSLGSSPPSDSPARKQNSPKPQLSSDNSENGSEPSSPTPAQQPPQQSQKSKDHTDVQSKSRSKENGTSVPAKKSKSDKKHKNNDTEDTDKYTIAHTQQSLFESETQNFLTNELDELESDRHSLLENHDLLDNSEHSLLEDDNTHNLLNDGNSEALMMQRHREMLAGLVETNHILPHMKTPLVNGYGLLDRDVSYLGNERPVSQMNRVLEPSALRARPRNEMLMRHDMLRDHAQYMPMQNVNVHMDSSSELLGANYHPNPNMLPPFGMRVDNSLGSSGLQSGPLPGATPGGPGALPPLPMPNMSYMLHNQQMMQNQQVQQQQGMVNGFDAPQSAAASEGRYLAENMDKFFTDFRQAQQMRLQRGADERYPPRPPPRPRSMLAAASLERDHKHRMNNMVHNTVRAAGDGDDDLDFDPFKETQKALAEMMETEMMQNSVSSGDSMERMRRSRLPPPGFGPAPLGAHGSAPAPHGSAHISSHISSHMNSHVNAHAHAHTQNHSQGYNTNSAMFADWTQMDPAIMSTSVAGANQSAGGPELLARFSQLGLGLGAPWPPKMPWSGVALPPGFAPSKPPQRPAECVDAN